MRRIGFMLSLTLLATALATGCSGPNSKLGYSTAEKDGRLYVFGYNDGAYQSFKKSGEVGKSKTYVGAGANGQTIIVADGVDAGPFLASKTK